MFLKKNVQPRTQETVPAPEGSPWNTPQTEDVRGHPLAGGGKQKVQKKQKKRKKNRPPARSKDELQEGNLRSCV